MIAHTIFIYIYNIYIYTQDTRYFISSPSLKHNILCIKLCYIKTCVTQYKITSISTKIIQIYIYIYIYT